jgi:hypothetical protein
MLWRVEMGKDVASQDGKWILDRDSLALRAVGAKNGPARLNWLKIFSTLSLELSMPWPNCLTINMGMLNRNHIPFSKDYFPILVTSKQIFHQSPLKKVSEFTRNTSAPCEPKHSKWDFGPSFVQRCTSVMAFRNAFPRIQPADSPAVSGNVRST